MRASIVDAPATDVATGFHHTCAVTSRGIRCWGWGGFGQLGVDPQIFVGQAGDGSSSPLPVAL